MATYKGWSNYETWCARLWLGNDDLSWAFLRETVEQEPDDHLAADHLKADMQESMPDLGATLWTDLLTATLEEIDWCAIVAAVRRDLEEN